MRRAIKAKVKKDISDNAKDSSDFLNQGIDPTKVLDLIVTHLKEEHNFSSEQIYNLIKKDKEEIKIPVSIFNDKLSSLETIVKYLRENVNLKNKEIANLLNRNVRTTWTTYNNAKKKSLQKLVLKEKDIYFIPISRFQNRLFSTLEVIVKHLKESYDLSLHKIAVLLKRNDSTIWTVYNRALKKSRASK